MKDYLSCVWQKISVAVFGTDMVMRYIHTELHEALLLFLMMYALMVPAPQLFSP